MILIISSFDSYHLLNRHAGVISLFNFSNMQTIITPTDFLYILLNAVNYAADMASALNAKLLVLHATELPLSTTFYNDEIEIENRLNRLKEELIRRTNNKIKIYSKQVPGII